MKRLKNWFRARNAYRSEKIQTKSGLMLTRAKGSANKRASKSAARVRDRVRHLQEYSPLMTSVIRETVLYIVGEKGVQVHPQPKNVDGSIHSEFAETLRRFFAEHSDAIDKSGEHDFATWQELVCSQWLRDGEVFVLLLEDAATALMGSDDVPFHMLDSRGYHDGIKRDGFFKATSYLFGKDKKAVPAESVIHLKNVNSINQGRGVSFFASVAEEIADLDRYTEAEINAAELAAKIVTFVETTDDYSVDEQEADDMKETIDKGGFFELPAGKKVVQHQAKKGAIASDTFVYYMCRRIAAGVGVAFSSIFKDYSKGAYSSLQMEANDSFRNVQRLQHRFTQRVVRPLYTRFIHHAVMKGQLVVPPTVDISTITDATYQAPHRAWVDQRKEAQAAETSINAGLTTLTEEQQKRGMTSARYAQEQAASFEHLEHNNVKTTTHNRITEHE